MEQSNPTATHCGYFLNATTDNPILMSGYLLQANATDGKGEVLLHRSLPLTSLTKFTPLYRNGSLLFKELRNTILDAMIVSSPDGTAEAVYRREKPIAQECVLAWCAKTILSTFTWGGYSEDIIDTHFNTTSGPFAWDANYTDTGTEQYTEIEYREDVNIDIDSTLYGVSGRTAQRTILGFVDSFPSTTTALNASATPLMRYQTWNDGDPWLNLLAFNAWMAPNNVTRHMQRLATAMTNTIRSAKGNQVSVRGNAYARKVFIHVTWAWLAFPLVLLMLSLVFLVATIIRTSKDTEGAGIWKTSAMPTLIYGLPKNAQDKVTPSAWNKSPEETKRIRIKLSPRMGWRVSDQSLRQPSPVLPVRNRSGAPPGWI